MPGSRGRKSFRTSLAVPAGVLVAIVPVARAGDWYVDVQAANCATGTGGPSDPFCNVGDALAVALDGDTIHVAPGTYFENLLVTEDVTLVGTGGAAATIVDGGALGTVMEIASGATVQIEELTIANGRAALGAGIRLRSGATLTLLRSIVRDNDAFRFSGSSRGGGVAVEQATLVVEGSEILDNFSGDDGAGIFSDAGTVAVTASTIAGNEAGGGFNDGDGGGVCSNGGILTLTSSTLEANRAGTAIYPSQRGAGGGIHVEGGTCDIVDCAVSDSRSLVGGGVSCVGGTLTISATTIEGNGAIGRVGGVYVRDSTATIAQCTISDNNTSLRGPYSTVASGGGVGTVGSIVTFTDCRIAGNHATHGGGAWVADSDVTFRNTTVLGNDATYDFVSGIGGGLLLDSEASVTLEDCAVVGNEASGKFVSDGGGIYAEGALALLRCTVAGNASLWPDDSPAGTGGIVATSSCSLDHCVVARNVGGIADLDGTFASQGWNCVGDTTGATITGNATGNLLDVDPQFVDAANGDWRLVDSSPCVDGGDPASRPAGMDVAANPRWLDGDLDRRAIVDPGAFEFDHVRLAVAGAATPGGSLTFTTSGTAGMPVLAFVGSGRSELQFRRYGALFVDLAQPWLLVPWWTIPSVTVVDLDPTLPVPLLVFVQQIAFAGGAGNFGNLVTIFIE